MRVISQDGTIDIPYEKVMIGISDQYGGILITAIYGKRKYVLGAYHDENVAEKVMEMLHETYESTITLEGGFDRVNNYYVQPNYWVLPNKIFRFPKDDEVQEE